MDTSAIRDAHRKRRAELPADRVAELSVDISARLWRQSFMSRARRIAAYFSVGGEVDCDYLIAEALRRGREVYLPIVRGSELRFAQYRAKTPLSTNRFGIPEPVCPPGQFRRPQEIDVVLTPLVAFDATGNRIGMGAGFYDRSFRFLRLRRHWTRPKLVGVAYEFQKTAQIKASSWDVPLHHAITEVSAYRFR